MAARPQISIGSLITNANMTQGGNASIWYYDWDVSTGSPSVGPVLAAITGTDLAGNSLGSTTQMNKALHLNGSSYAAIQDNGNGQSYPLRRSPGGGISGNQPWMVNVIFKRTATANQTIWAQRETGGGSSDKVKIKVSEPQLLAITIEQALELYNKGTVFIDAREPEYFEDGHIMGAWNIPFFF